MEFSPPWKKAKHEIKHGFMVVGKKYENRIEKQRNALRQPGFLNEGNYKSGAGVALTPSTEHLGTLCSQGGPFCTDCCRNHLSSLPRKSSQPLIMSAKET